MSIKEREEKIKNLKNLYKFIQITDGSHSETSTFWGQQLSLKVLLLYFPIIRKFPGHSIGKKLPFDKFLMPCELIEKSPDHPEMKQKDISLRLFFCICTALFERCDHINNTKLV